VLSATLMDYSYIYDLDVVDHSKLLNLANIRRTRKAHSRWVAIHCELDVSIRMAKLSSGGICFKNVKREVAWPIKYQNL
jgi:hypothetical protein